MFNVNMGLYVNFIEYSNKKFKEKETKNKDSGL